MRPQRKMKNTRMANSDSDGEPKNTNVGFKKGGEVLNYKNNNKRNNFNDDNEEAKVNKAKDDGDGQSGFRKFVPPT